MADRKALWATARNNGYEIDEEAPAVVTSFVSIPYANVLTPDASVYVGRNEMIKIMLVK